MHFPIFLNWGRKGENELNVAICDSNMAVYNEHKEHVFEIAKKNHLSISLSEYTSGKELLKEYREKRSDMDLVFIDVDLHDIDGDKVTSELRRLGYNNDIIFHTSCTEIKSIKKAFKHDALDYLIKQETTKEEFEEVFVKAISKFKERENEYIMLSFAGETVNIDIKDIYYFEYISKKLFVYYGDNQKFVFCDTLRRLAKELEPYGFLRIHTGYLANMNNIQTIRRGEIVMKNGDTLIINKRRTSELKSIYHSFMGLENTANTDAKNKKFNLLGTDSVLE